MVAALADAMSEGIVPAAWLPVGLATDDAAVEFTIDALMAAEELCCEVAAATCCIGIPTEPGTTE